jgi:EpsI family protein
VCRHKFKYSTVIFFISLVVLFVGNISTIKAITAEWLSVGAYNHGFLGLAMVLYVSWTKINIFKKINKRVSSLGIVGLLASLFLLLLSTLASTQQLQQLSLFLVFVFIIISVYGVQSIKVFILPLSMLLLILPIWNILQYPLREISTLAGYYGANLLGVDIQKDGYYLITSGGMFSVEPACSGLGFFLVSAFLALCVIFFNQLSLNRSVKFLIIALVFSLVANWVRIISIVVVGSYTHMQHFIVQDHLTFGWYVFFVFLIPLFFISNRFFSENTTDESATPSKHNSNNQQRKSSYLKEILILFIVLIFAIAQYYLPTRFDNKYRYTLSNLSKYQWIVKNKPMSPNWQPIFYGASHEKFNYYNSDDNAFQVYVADYIKQSQGKEIIYIKNTLYDPNRWQEVQQSQLDLGKHNKINLLDLQRRSDRGRSIAYLYFINKYYISDKKLAKLYEAIAAIKGKPGASIIAIAVDYKMENREKAINNLKSFAHDLLVQPNFNIDH